MECNCKLTAADDDVDDDVVVDDCAVCRLHACPCRCSEAAAAAAHTTTTAAADDDGLQLSLQHLQCTH